MCPHGNIVDREVLGIMDIWNNGSGSDTIGNYGYCAWPAGTPKDILHFKNTVNKAKWSGSVVNFPRKKLLAWDLLLRCLKDSFGDRNEED